MTSMKSKAPVKTNESGVRGKVLPKATKTRRDYGDKKKMYTHGPLAEDTTEAAMSSHPSHFKTHQQYYTRTIQD